MRASFGQVDGLSHGEAELPHDGQTIRQCRARQKFSVPSVANTRAGRAQRGQTTSTSPAKSCTVICRSRKIFQRSVMAFPASSQSAPFAITLSMISIFARRQGRSWASSQ
jgi:hypothetical protein